MIEEPGLPYAMLIGYGSVDTFGSRKRNDVVQDVTANFGDTVHIQVVHLLPRFQRRHIEQEEEHLRERLETMMYDIDAVDTVTLIKGQKGFEKV